MKYSRYLAAGTAALAIGIGGFLTWQSFGVRDAAPAVAYTLLNGQKGQLDALRGKVVLVNFWATSCTTCVKEMPEIVKTYEKYRAQGYETLAVAMDYDPPAFVAKFAESRRLPFSVTIDSDGEMARRFGDVRMTPTTFLINKRGEIVKRYLGAPDFEALHALVEQLLNESSS